MKSWIVAGTLLSSVALTGALAAQSLSEVAAKEKARRAQNQKDGKSVPAKVVDEKALKEARGDSLSVTGEEVSTAPQSLPATPTTTTRPTATGSSPVPRAGPPRRRDERAPPTQQEIDRRRQLYKEAAQELERLKQAAHDCAYARMHSALYWTVGCEGIEERVKQMQKRVEELSGYR